MKNLIYIYNNQFIASILAWILQQSNTIDSNFCLYDSTNADPWDNHHPNVSDKSNGDFLHDLICIQEDEKRNVDELTAHVKSFTKYNFGVVGNAYGQWEHKTEWNCDGLTKIYTYMEDADLMTDLWLNVYFKREFNASQIRESMWFHCNDHHFKDTEYKDEMLTRHLNRAEELLKEQGVLYFWQLQALYHGSWKELLPLDRYNEYRNEMRKGVLMHQPSNVKGYDNHFINHNTCIIADMMNINFEELCDTLNIEFNPKMQSEYETFKLFVEDNT